MHYCAVKLPGSDFMTVTAFISGVPNIFSFRVILWDILTNLSLNTETWLARLSLTLVLKAGLIGCYSSLFSSK